jgi:integrase
MSEHHELMDGRLHLYKRENSRHWQCSTFLNGRNWRKTTKEESLAHAKDIAEDWYLELRGKARAGILKTGKTFAEAAKHFLDEYITLIKDERSAKYIKGYEEKIRVHLNPFFGTKVLSEITAGLVQDYRVHRTKMTTPYGTYPARSTLKNETVALRQVLKFAHRKGWLDHVPDVSAPYKASGKVGHRAWFSPAEYKQLYEATRARAGTKRKRQIHKWMYEQLHDLGLFMANTGLRPDEATRLEFRDVTIVKDDAAQEGCSRSPPVPARSVL